MTKRLLCILILALVLITGCSSNKTESQIKENKTTYNDSDTNEDNREKVRVWKYSELNELNSENIFVPNNPQKNVFVLVVNDASKFERRELDNTTEFELEQQSSPLINLFKKLNYLKAITNPQENIMEQYNIILREKNMENIPLEIATDPNKASIIIEYKVTYPEVVKYTSGKEDDENTVNVYSCKLEFTAYDSISRELLGSVSFVTEAKGNISVIQDYKTEMFMDIPTVYERDNAKKMVDFLLPLVK